MSTPVAVPEVSVQEVWLRLAPYDLGRNPALAARHPPGQYPHTRRCATLVPLFHCPTDGRLRVLLTVRSASLRSVQGSGQVQVRSGQVRSVEFRSGQVRSGQVS